MRNERPHRISDDQLRQQILPLQIIVLGLAGGVAVFAGVLWLIIRPQQWFGPLEFLNVFGLFGAAISLVGSYVVGFAFDRNSSQDSSSLGRLTNQHADRQKTRALRQDVLLAKLSSETVIRCAILEGAAFFNLIACVVSFNSWNVIAAGALAGFILLRVPTVWRVTDWLERQSA